MAEEVARLVAVMEAQLRGFTKGMEQAQAEADRRFGAIERRMNQTERRFQNSFKDLGSLATRVGGALGVAFSVEGLINFGKQVVTSVAQLSEQAQQLQVGVEAMQAYRIAFKESGSSAETADRAIGLLNKTLGEAQEGSKSARQQFAQLGLSFSELSRVSPDERLAVVAKALLSISDGSKRAALETQFFGRTGREIESVLARLATGAHSLTEEYKEQGRIIDAELAKKTDDAMDRIAAAFDRGKAATAPFFASIAEGIANALGELAGLPPTIDALTDQLKEAQKLANNLKNPGMLGRLWSDVTHLPDRAKGADAIVEQIAGEIVRRSPTPEITPGLFKGAATGTGPAALGELDKFFAKMQLIAELAGELPAEREKDQKLIEAATAKLDEEGRSNIKLLSSMKDVNDVLNEQVGLREKILKVIEEENAAAAKAAFQERLNTARFNAGVTAGKTIPGGVLGRPSAEDQRLGTNVVPDVTITPRVGTFQPTVRPIPALDEAVREHADQIAKERIEALAETQKKLLNIDSREQTIIEELKEESRIAGLLPREREEEIELLRIKQRFGSDFVEQHKEEFQALIRNRQAAEDFANIQSAAVEGFADVGAAALTGAGNVQQAFAQMLASLAQYIIKLELAKALEATLGSLGGGGGGGPLGFLGTIAGFLAGGLSVPDVTITPQLAGGGHVSKDQPYIVGESGRELFVPEVSGFIVPHKKTEEIVKAQEGRASGGPVSAGHSYTVGESGRELFVPSISGIIYPKIADTNQPDHAHGRQVIAGQPIVVGEHGHEVFIPDVSADVSVTVRHPSTNTEEIAVAQNAPVIPPAPAQQSAAVADQRRQDALKKSDATASGKRASEAHHISEKRGTEVFARDSSEHTHQSEIAKSSEHEIVSHTREAVRDILSREHSTSEHDTRELIRDAASEVSKSESNTVVRTREALLDTVSQSVLHSHLAQSNEHIINQESRREGQASKRLTTDAATSQSTPQPIIVGEPGSDTISRDVSKITHAEISKSAEHDVSTQEAIRDILSRSTAESVSNRTHSDIERSVERDTRQRIGDAVSRELRTDQEISKHTQSETAIAAENNINTRASERSVKRDVSEHIRQEIAKATERNINVDTQLSSDAVLIKSAPTVNVSTPTVEPSNTQSSASTHYAIEDITVAPGSRTSDPIARQQQQHVLRERERTTTDKLRETMGMVSPSSQPVIVEERAGEGATHDVSKQIHSEIAKSAENNTIVSVREAERTASQTAQERITDHATTQTTARRDNILVPDLSEHIQSHVAQSHENITNQDSRAFGDQVSEQRAKDEPPVVKIAVTTHAPASVSVSAAERSAVASEHLRVQTDGDSTSLSHTIRVGDVSSQSVSEHINREIANATENNNVTISTREAGDKSSRERTVESAKTIVDHRSQSIENNLAEVHGQPRAQHGQAAVPANLQPISPSSVQDAVQRIAISNNDQDAEAERQRTQKDFKAQQAINIEVPSQVSTFQETSRVDNRATTTTAEPRLEKSYPIGELGQELFIPQVPGFVYSKVPSSESKTGTRDIVKVLSRGQPIIVGGGRGREVFVPYLPDDDDQPDIQTPSQDTIRHQAPTWSSMVGEHPQGTVTAPSLAIAASEPRGRSELDATTPMDHDTRPSASQAFVGEPGSFLGSSSVRHQEPDGSAGNSRYLSAGKSEVAGVPSGLPGKEPGSSELQSQDVADSFNIPGTIYSIAAESADAVAPAATISRASGGPVSPGYFYTVGEQGRELFTPSTSGKVSVQSFALGGILGGLLGGGLFGGFGGQSTSAGAFGLLSLLGVKGGALGLGGGALGFGSSGAFGLGADKAGIGSFDLLDWLKDHFAQGGVMGPQGRIPVKAFKGGGLLGSLFGGLLGGFGGQVGSLGAFGLLGSFGSKGGISGALGIGPGSALGGFNILDLFKHHLAQGGIMGERGPIPLTAYQSGGIANSPQLALFGEGSGPEAFVPLQGGKIPVRLQVPQIGTPASVTDRSEKSIYIDARGAQEGVAEQIQKAMTNAFPAFVGASVKTVERNFASMYRRAARDKL